MRIVFGVSHGEYSSWDIAAVFSTEEDARAFIERWNGTTHHPNDNMNDTLEEWEVRDEVPGVYRWYRCAGDVRGSSPDDREITYNSNMGPGDYRYPSQMYGDGSPRWETKMGKPPHSRPKITTQQQNWLKQEKSYERDDLSGKVRVVVSAVGPDIDQCQQAVRDRLFEIKANWPVWFERIVKEKTP